MKQRYTYYRRENGIYYAIDALTKKRQSLNTTTPEEACRLLGTLNEACKQPAINLQHSDPDYAKRTWRLVMDRLGEMKTGNTLKRCRKGSPSAPNVKRFDCSRPTSKKLRQVLSRKMPCACPPRSTRKNGISA